MSVYESKRRRALLLGGTGAMGVYLVPILENSGWLVDITSRTKRPKVSNAVEFIQGNAKDYKFLNSLLKGGQHYDAIVDFMVYSSEEFARRRDILLDSCDHYVFMSSYRVYANAEGVAINENSPRLLESIDDDAYLSTDEYGLSKARQEDILREAALSNWTIIRPAITYSKERFQLATMEANEFLHRAIKHKTIVFPREMLNKLTTMTWAGDVAKMIALILLNKAAYKEAFIASTDEFHSWKEILKIYQELLDFKVRLISLRDYEKAIGRPYQIKYDRMFDRVIDNSKVLKITGMKRSDLMPLREGLKIELTSFSRSPKFGSPNKMFDAMVEERTSPAASRSKMLLKRPNLMKCLNLFKESTPNSRFGRACILTIQGHENYGCILQNYALQEAVKSLGFSVYTLDLERQRPFDPNGLDAYTRNCYTAQKNQIEFVNRRISRSSLIDANDIAIVGSDQVWNPYFNKGGRFWAKEFKGKKIAYAASFGDKNNSSISDPYKGAVRCFAPRFEHISVRESEGVEILSKNASKTSQVTCDPTLLQERGFYESIIPKKRRCDRFWFGYMIKDEQLENDAIDLAKHKAVNFENINMYREVLSNKDLLHSVFVEKQYPKVEEWLGFIRDSELVLTSSFHAVVFSLIFHSDFYYLQANGHIDGRIEELLIRTDTLERAIGSLNEINEKKKQIVWSRVDESISKMRNESFAWLEGALKK